MDQPSHHELVWLTSSGSMFNCLCQERRLTWMIDILTPLLWQLWKNLSDCFHKHRVVNEQHHWSALPIEIALNPRDYVITVGKKNSADTIFWGISMMIELTNILEHKFLEPENCGDCTDRPPGEHVLGVVIGQRYSGLTTNRTAWGNNFWFTFDGHL